VPRSTGAGAVGHTTTGLDYQLITTTSCRKHGTFHKYLLEQFSQSRRHKITGFVQWIFVDHSTGTTWLFKL